MSIQGLKGRVETYVSELPSWRVMFRAYRIGRHANFVSQVQHPDIVESVRGRDRTYLIYWWLFFLA